MNLEQIFAFLHRIFLKFIHLLFAIVNYGKKAKLPPIKNCILLESASSLAAKIRKGEIKSADVIEAYFSRIQDVNPYITAVAKLRYQEALNEAINVDKFIASGEKSENEIERDTPFLGVPFSSKEIISVKGMPITVGVVCRKGLTADDDCEAVRLLRKAGAIPIAVTNLSELSMWGESINNVYGRTSNAYNITRTAGGSTGGEGALLGAAGSVIGLGSDIGGSIRIPCCFNGVFGHKTTSGIISRVGLTSIVNPSVTEFSCLGPMCRYATDLLPMLKILSADNSNRLKLDNPVHFENLKIYYIDDTSDINFVTSIHPDVKSAVQKAVHHFETAYNIKPKKLNIEYVPHSSKIYFAKMHEKGGVDLEQALFPNNKSVSYCWEFLLWLFGYSKHVFSILYVSVAEKIFNNSDLSFGLMAYDKSLKMFQNILDENSVFIYPTWPEPAPYHNELLFKLLDFSTFTGIFNLFKFPSTHCPMGLSKEGLPIGIQVVGNVYNDHLTIAVAVELEKAFGGWICPS